MSSDRRLEDLPIEVILEVQEHYVRQHFKERAWHGVERRRAWRWRRHQRLRVVLGGAAPPVLPPPALSGQWNRRGRRKRAG